jgi:hypothetical protein
MRADTHISVVSKDIFVDPGGRAKCPSSRLFVIMITISQTKVPEADAAAKTRQEEAETTRA